MHIRNCLSIATATLLLSAPAAVSIAQDSSVVAPIAGERTPILFSPSDSGHAQKTFFTRRDLVATVIATGVSIGVMQFDKKIAAWTQQRHVQGGSGLHKTISDLTRINETPLTIASVVTYGIGRLTNSQTTADVGLHWTEALVLTDVFSQAIRGPLGRARPRVSQDDPFKFDYWSGFTKFENRAFPSLHSAVGFATAASLLGEIRMRNPSATWYAAPLLYGFAMVPGLTRMYLNQHWASDVVAGAFIGQLMGSRVVHYAHTHKRNKLDRALLATTVLPDGHGGMMVMVSTQSLFGDAPLGPSSP
jgi:membrane-associated phospholipid phosphatase